MEIKNKKYKNLEVKVSNEKIDYLESISFLENRVDMIYKEKERELIWFLEHPSIYTSGRGQFIKTKHIKIKRKQNTLHANVKINPKNLQPSNLNDRVGGMRL